MVLKQISTANGATQITVEQGGVASGHQADCADIGS